MAFPLFLYKSRRNAWESLSYDDIKGGKGTGPWNKPKFVNKLLILAFWLKFANACAHVTQETELHHLVKESRQIEAQYGHYFDWIIMNDDFQVAADMLKEVARRLEDEAQWVPACWMQEMWTLAAEIVIILDTTSHVSCCLLLVSNHDGYVLQHNILIIRDQLFFIFKTILFDLLPIQNQCRVYKIIHNHVHQLHVLLLVFRTGSFCISQLLNYQFRHFYPCRILLA